ncbi:MAG: hypothetical protein WC444_04805 [Candidatus Paceibacterota bacterium]
MKTHKWAEIKTRKFSKKKIYDLDKRINKINQKLYETEMKEAKQCAADGCRKKSSASVAEIVINHNWVRIAGLCSEHFAQRLRELADKAERLVKCPYCDGTKWTTATDGIHAMSFKCVCPECVGYGKVTRGRAHDIRKGMSK